jgi:cobalt-zinc-cadmium efflux system membrane fusion protein
MRKKMLYRLTAALTVGFATLLGISCSDQKKPEPTKAEVKLEPGVFDVDHPELFKLVKVESRDLPTLVKASGSITPDVNRTIHVTSQGSGRVVDLRVRLGDYVEKGQPLLSIYSGDLTGAFSDFQKATADERLSKKALDRSQLLYSHGAIAQRDFEQADDAEQKAQVDVQNAAQHIRVLGGDPNHPSSQIELRAPVSGTIVEQNISGFEGVKSLDNSPNLFTIADLSQVWVLCDVFENDLGQVQVGDAADVQLNAFQDRAFHGKVSDISRVLDPATRAAKVRIVLDNPKAELRPGMYAAATFRSRKMQPHLVIPGTSVMRLQDRDWIFHKESDRHFRQIEVHIIGDPPDGMHSVQEGPVHEGDEIVLNALEFSTAMAGGGK